MNQKKHQPAHMQYPAPSTEQPLRDQEKENQGQLGYPLAPAHEQQSFDLYRMLRL